jgi:hypothetical protein
VLFSLFYIYVQEIKDFNFNPGPIGMIVELRNSKVKDVILFPIKYLISKLQLLCVKVLPKSQCSFYEQALVGSQVIAVNGKRVM